MGFFSKVWGGLKRAASKIGKGIKSAFRSVGKFVNKLGIVGQIGLALIMPGIGGMIGSFATGLAAQGGLAGAIGNIMVTAGKFASTAGNAFKTVTDGVLGFVKNIGGGMVNKTASLLGKNTPLIGSAPSTASEGFSQWMQGMADDVKGITSPFRDAATEVTKEAVTDSFDKIVSGGFDTTIDGTIPDSGVTVGDGVVDLANSLGPKTSPDTGFSIPDALRMDKNSTFAQDLKGDTLSNILKVDTEETKTWLQKMTDFGVDVGTTAVENAAETFSTQVGSGIAQSTGLGPDNTQEFTQVTNVIPEFNSTPIANMMNQNGFSVGAVDGVASAMQFQAYDAYRPLLQGAR